MGKPISRRVWGIGVAIAALFLGAVLFSVASSDDEATAPELDEAIEQALAEITPGPAFSAQAYNQVAPSLLDLLYSIFEG